MDINRYILLGRYTKIEVSIDLDVDVDIDIHISTDRYKSINIDRYRWIDINRYIHTYIGKGTDIDRSVDSIKNVYLCVHR